LPFFGEKPSNQCASRLEHGSGSPVGASRHQGVGLYCATPRIPSLTLLGQSGCRTLSWGQPTNSGPWVICLVFLRSRRASVGRACETGPQKSSLVGVIWSGGQCIPLSHLFRKEGGVGHRHVIPLKWGHFSWCPFELLAGVSFRVRSRIPFAGDLM
jgi:hypothetical protein